MGGNLTFNDNDDVQLKGATDDTLIGNVGPNLKVTNTIQDGNQLDASGRLRVSEADLVESLYFVNTTHPLLVLNSVTGSATVSRSVSTSALRLSTTTSSSDSAIAQTRRYFRYLPGRSYMVTISGIVGAKKSGTRQRLGFFDALNGLFFQQTSTTLSVAVRTDASGSAVDTVVGQSSWNIDKLDGTGTSGITLDTSKHNLYVIDFLWHGAGRIRFGIFYNGQIVYCHQINAANTNSAPFMRLPTLPIRAELTNTGTVGSTTNMDLVCFAYQKESRESIQAPYSFSASTGRSSTIVGSTILPVISIRPKATFNGSTNRVPVIPENCSVVSNNQPVIVSIILNPTLTGSSWTSADSNSATEYDISSTAISGGTVVKQFYVAASTSLSATTSSTASSTARNIILGLDIPGTTADIITVAVQSTAGGTTTFAQIDWQEFQ